MKKLNLKKIIASSVIAFSFLALNPIGASAEWRQNQTGWWYAEGSSYSIGWKLIDGQYYYFSSNGYMMHDTYIDGYRLGSDGAWVVSTPRVSTTSSTTNSDFTSNPVNLRVLGGVQTNKTLLSCKNDGTVADLWTEDDGSGRQKWQFIRVNGESNVYNIRVVNGINDNRKYLSANTDGTAVDLWYGDDGSGRQRWKVTPMGNNSYSIQVYGGVSSNRKYLSTYADGSKVDLWPNDDLSGRQRWLIPNGTLR
jgi:hypothetical protein